MGWRHPEHCLTSRRFTICRIDTIHFITGPVGVYYSKDSKERGRDGRRAGSARDSIQIPHTRFWSIFRGVFGRSSLLVAKWLALAYIVVVAGRRIAFIFARGVYEGDIRGLEAKGCQALFWSGGKREYEHEYERIIEEFHVMVMSKCVRNVS
jgi:hypothetical protein